MTFTEGQAVRWYRNLHGKRYELQDAIIVRRLTSQSVIIRAQDGEHCVRAENLMPVGEPPTLPTVA